MITVIADDLTGAAEIAGICLRYAINVSFGIDAIPKKPTQVTVVATDTRSLSEEDAYNLHQQLAKKVIENHPKQLIYKKCDSVLRGHVLTELSALLAVTGKTKALLQPSNPVGHRCIQNGIYHINAIEIENTGFASDPDFPAKSSSVKNLLLDRSSKKEVIQVYSGTISEIHSNGVFIPNCKDEMDLISNLNLYNDDLIIGGSAAFFEQFLIKLKLASTKITNEAWRFSVNYLLISGSTHPQSIAFSEKLQNQNCPILQFPEALLNEVMDDECFDKWIQKISENYNQNNKIGLRISNEIIQFSNSSIILKSRLSALVKGFLERSNCNELFIEGGATAYDVLKKLEWHAFTPVCELASGVVRMQYNGNPKKHITIKPGSYQWPNGLLN